MHRALRIALLSASVCFTTAVFAADDLVPASPTGGFFGSITGSYILSSPTDEWTMFSGPADYTGLGDGGLVSARLGYRFSDWDVAVYGQYGSFSDGTPSASFPVTGPISADHFAIDLELGYNVAVGSHAHRYFGGIRYARWDHTATPSSGAGPVFHDFDGFGPKIGFQGTGPIGAGNLTLEYGAGASLLFGDIRTSAGPGWNCAQCTNYSTTAYSLDAEIGLGWDFGAARAVLGWQAQYWGNVNVDTTDATGAGLNTGTSGHWLTGPFLRVAF